MTEAEWSALPDYRKLLEGIESKVSDRKLRLFAVACCRSVWPLLTPEGRKAVEIAESFADGLVTIDELHGIREAFRVAETYEGVSHIVRGRRYRPDLGGHAADENALWAARYAMRESADLATWRALRADGRDFTATEFGNMLSAEMATRRRLLHDVVGPVPFSRVTVRPSWLGWNSGIVRRTAAGIYEERAFDRLPILHDGLLDAGCDNEDILAHCRGAGPHVRGCWVIDLILGKE
jgi:hypothetical protein